MQVQRFDAVQQQKLKLSPHLIESIRLMALSAADLRERIAEELEANPALELAETASEEISVEPDVSLYKADSMELFSGAAADSAEIPLDRECGEFLLNEASEVYENEAVYGDTDSENVRRGTFDSHQAFLEGAVSRGETLQEHLLAQLGELSLPDSMDSLARAIIQNLDEHGFNCEDPSLLPGGNKAEQLAEVLSVIRHFDPPGTAFSGFRESLIFQAENRGNAPPAALAILNDHMDLLKKMRPGSIAKILDISEEAVRGALDFIRSLDPFPGSAYGGYSAAWVIPDVIVKRGEDDFTVIINDEEYPVLDVSPVFISLSENPQQDARSRNFARRSIKDARWFMNSIEQRNITLLKTVRSIIMFQKQFFLKGPAFLRPLRMQDVAVNIDMHEATVSRISSRKYLQCEWGFFELKYFFSSSIVPRKSGSASPAVALPSSGLPSAASRSKEAVKQMLFQIIEEEKGCSLSDRELTDILSLRGIQIARRTVAKYRSELTIRSSFER